LEMMIRFIRFVNLELSGKNNFTAYNKPPFLSWIYFFEYAYQSFDSSFTRDSN
jgi:hypothetical protein